MWKSRSDSGGNCFDGFVFIDYSVYSFGVNFCHFSLVSHIDLKCSNTELKYFH